MKSNSGFTLIELMIVVAIISFLSMLAIPSLMKFLAKSKRAEAYINLASLAMAEKAYFAEHGKYTTDLTGKNGLGWKPEGKFNYTYGFSSGSEGKSYFTGQLKAPAGELSGSNINQNSFTVCAAGDIDNDGESDVICINQNNEVTIVKDDLA